MALIGVRYCPQSAPTPVIVGGKKVAEAWQQCGAHALLLPTRDVCCEMYAALAYTLGTVTVISGANDIELLASPRLQPPNGQARVCVDV